MAASGYTPIILFNSGTASNVPTTSNLAVGELAINYADGKLYYNTGSAIKVLAGAGGAGIAGGSNTQVQYNSSGNLAGSANLTFNGTTLTANTLNLTNALGTAYGGTGLTSFTANGVVYASSTSALTTGSALTFDGTTLNNSGAFGSSTAAFTLKNTSASSTSNIVEQQFWAGNTFSGLVSIAAFGADTSTGVGNQYGSFYWKIANAGAPTEKMRLTSTGLGIGQTSPATALDVVGVETFRGAAAAGAILTITPDASSGANGVAYNTTFSTGGAGPHIFSIGGSEQMRLTSTGLGIGTSSPAYKLDLVSSAAAVINLNSTNTAGPEVRFASSGTRVGDVGTGKVLTGGSATDFGINAAGANSLIFATNDTERARIDSSGNMAIGQTTAVSGGSGARWLTIGTSGGTTYSGGVIYSVNGTVQVYEYQDSDNLFFFQGNNSNVGFKWQTQGSERMRLNSSGNLGIGLTSPNFKLNVYGPVAAQWITPNATEPAFVMGDTANATAGIWFQNTFSANNATQMIFKTRTSGGSVNEVARFDSAGNFLVSTTSTASVTYGSSQITISDGISTEYASLTSAGIYESFHSTTSLQYTALFKNGNGTVGSISTSGSATTFSTSSDYRLKNTIAPMTGALAKVAALKPVTYKWNVDGSDGEGFIAHELAEVCPHAVTGAKDAVDANGKPIYQGIDTSFLVATLTAAIQELKAEFDAYKASHP
jgi:hypothetical protein